MTKRELYRLNFQKLNIQNWGIRFTCTSFSPSTSGSPQLAMLLDVLSDREPDSLLEEIESALNGDDFEEIYRPDSSTVDKIEIIPPNAIINESFTISLTELKALLEEWIEFVDN